MAVLIIFGYRGIISRGKDVLSDMDGSFPEVLYHQLSVVEEYEIPLSRIKKTKSTVTDHLPVI